MMKKISCILIIAFIALTAFSCGNANENPSNNDGTEQITTVDQLESDEETIDYANDDLGEYDFEGYVFNVLSRASGYINVEEETGDILDDAMYTRNRNIEERFNFTIKERRLEGADMSLAKTSLLAGDKSYDLMIIRCPDAYVYAQEGLIYSINDLPHVNLDKPYWDQSLTKEWSIANKTYFASSAADLPAYTHTVALLFNKQLAEDLGIENLYQLVKDGKWTFDKFAEIGSVARSDLNGDGAYDENDQYGYLATLRMISPAFWISGGVKTIEKDNDGIPKLTASESKFIEVYEKLINITLTSNVWYQAKSPDVLNDPLLIDMFKNGKGLFYDSTFGGIPALRDMEIDFGILPYPKYNENQSQHYTRLGWAELTCVPSYSDEKDLERTSVILEALACESAKSVIPAYYELALKTKSTRDEESESMIDILFNTRVFDFGDTIWSEYLRDGIFAKIYLNKSDTLVSELEKNEKKINTAIDKTVNAFLALE